MLYTQPHPKVFYTTRFTNRPKKEPSPSSTAAPSLTPSLCSLTVATPRSGSSTDQDSFAAYRYGADTDSGLGRATPPRRAPSPGMGPVRHLPSPSGPGSLPGLMSKRRVFDDGSSDISSTPSSMMDYTGGSVVFCWVAVFYW